MFVSVIIAAHNCEKTIYETLTSLRAQTHPAWEAIIIDDGSTDATSEVVERFAASDERFRIVRQTNRGVSIARNVGIEHARYDWLLFLDADDWLLPRHLELLTDALAADSSLDAVYCGWAYVTPDGHYVFKDVGGETGDLFALHAQECPFAIHSYIVRRDVVEAVGGFDPALRVCEDWDLWQRFARTGARFGHVKGMLAPYRMRAGSASTDGRRILSDGLHVLMQGHAPDARIPEPHPVYPNGLPGRANKQKFYLLCSAAGLSIGRRQDARYLFELLEGDPPAHLDAYSVVECIIQSAMLSACRPLAEWDELWHELEPYAVPFLQTLEERSRTPGLAHSGTFIARRLIRRHVAALSTYPRLRAYQARLLLRAIRLKPGLRRRMHLHSWYVKHLAKNGLRMAPRLDRRVHTVWHRHSAEDAQTHFEDLFAEQPDPWNYTNAYEQTKYEQTLDMLPEGPIDQALELACAEGHFSVQLAPGVNHLLATDISETAVKRAAMRCHQEGLTNVTFRQLDLVKDPMPGRFDLIVCSEVLYFVGSYSRCQAVARKLAKALKPGGHLVLAHGNVVSDEPNQPGFDWEHPFGAKRIGEAFADIRSLLFKKELRTPLYRIQLFQRQETTSVAANHRAPAVIEMKHPMPLPPEVASQVLWHGRAERFPVLMYHRIAPTGSEALEPWRVTPTAFEQQLRLLQEEGFRSARLEEWRNWVYKGYPLPRNVVFITFDDGYLDFHQYAWPLLKEYGFTATVYLVADEIGGTNRWDHSYGEQIPLLGWREIRELQREGVSFGSHSSTHRMLTKLPVKEVVRELQRSQHTLEEGLGTGVHSFAYPYGEFNRRIQYLTGVCGYEFGLSCRPGPCTANDSLLALRRIEVEGIDTLQTFSAKLALSSTPVKQQPVTSTVEVPYGPVQGVVDEETHAALIPRSQAPATRRGTLQGAAWKER